MQLKEGIRLHSRSEAKQLAHLFHRQPSVAVRTGHGFFQQGTCRVPTRRHQVPDELIGNLNGNLHHTERSMEPLRRENLGRHPRASDDIDGTIVEERIYHDAGATTSRGLRRHELLQLIRKAGRTPVERDTHCRPVERSEATFTVLV